MEPSATSLPGLANWHLSLLNKLHIGSMQNLSWPRSYCSILPFDEDAAGASDDLLDLIIGIRQKCTSGWSTQASKCLFTGRVPSVAMAILPAWPETTS